MTVTFFIPPQDNKFVEKSANWDLKVCQKRSEKNDKISCELIQCAENDWLLSEILSVEGNPIMLQFQRYNPQVRIRWTDPLDDGKLKTTLDTYKKDFCKLKIF